MIDRVIGKNDHFEVIFTHNQEKDNWEATLPPNILGEYYIDLYAFDKAGNVGYMAKALFTVDTSNLCVHLLETKYYANVYYLNNYEIELTVNNLVISVEFVNLFCEEIGFTSDYMCRLKEVLPCNIV